MAEDTKRASRAKRDDARDDIRDTSGPEIRERADGGIDVILDGEVYTRSGTSNDPFYIPPEVVPNHYSYEFKRHSVVNQTDATYEAELQRNGWRVVNHETHPGVFAPIGSKGPIMVRGLMLMRRPMILTEQAREDDRRRSVDQERSKRASFEEAAMRGLQSNSPPPGIKPAINKAVMPVPRGVGSSTAQGKTFPIE